MALNAANLGNEMEAAVRNAMELDSETEYPKLTAYCQAIAGAIVSHIVANAQINNGQAASTTTNSALDGLNAHTHSTTAATVTGGII